MTNDGLLGNNFLSKHCNVEGPAKLLKFPRTEINENEFCLPFANCDIEELREFPTKKNNQTKNFAEPNLIDDVRTNQNTKFSAKGTNSNMNHDENRRIELPEPVYIPGRSHKIIRIPLQIPFPMLCEAQEISPGIFLANSIIQAQDMVVSLGILNINKETFKLVNVNLELRDLHDYEIRELQPDQVETTDRERPDATVLSNKLVNYAKISGNSNKALKSECEITRIAQLMEELKIDESLNTEEREALLKIFREYNDVFYLTGDRLSYTTAIEHTIPLVQDQAPIYRKMYRLPEIHREIISTQVREMLENDIVQRSKSPWNSPLLVVPKKNGPDGERRWRVVVDFRFLNQKTIPDVFPLPRIEDILDQLGHSRYFTTLDLASGYHQVLVHPEDREKTAFSTSYGHYEFKRMPFGLRGAPSTFQRLMNHILTGLQGIECFVFLDDVVIYAKNLEDHNIKLRKVLERLRANNLKLQPTKCHFLRKEVVYLGHKCTSEGVMPDPSNTECVKNFPVPLTVKQVQSFLGLANFYRKYIPNFSKIVLPMNKLLRKGVKFIWSAECQTAFETIKNALVAPPLLIYPDFSKPFILTTALGAILSPGDTGEDKPIAYASRSLNKAEQNYSTIEKELLAIVWAVRNFRCYLLGRKFTVHTDTDTHRHMPLKGLFNMKDPTSRIARFHYKLSEFDFNIEYKPGKNNTNADALSRIPTTKNQSEIQLNEHNTFIHKAQVHHSYDSDIDNSGQRLEPKNLTNSTCQCQIITHAKQKLIDEQKDTTTKISNNHNPNKPKNLQKGTNKTENKYNSTRSTDLKANCVHDDQNVTSTSKKDEVILQKEGKKKKLKILNEM